jgi:hypothetical protein
MNKLGQTSLLVIAGLVALIMAGPTLIRVLQVLAPLVLVVGAVVAVLQLVRYFTRQ